MCCASSSDMPGLKTGLPIFQPNLILFPLRDKSANEVATMLEERVLAYVGPPHIFHSDVILENKAYMYWVKEQLCIKLLVAEVAWAVSAYLSSVLL